MGGDSRVRGCEQPRLLTTELELIIPAPRADRGRGAEAEGVQLSRTAGRDPVGGGNLSLHLQIGAGPCARASLVLPPFYTHSNSDRCRYEMGPLTVQLVMGRARLRPVLD